MKNKKAQKRSFPKRKDAQEEMVGFALIMVLVAVIFLIFLGFSLRNPSSEGVESYEVASFLQGVVQYTTDCEILGRGYRPIQNLIFNCQGIDGGDICEDGRKSCDVLEETLENLVESSWNAGEEFPVKRYELKIYIEDVTEPIIVVEKGDATGDYKGDKYIIPGGQNAEISFTAYY